MKFKRLYFDIETSYNVVASWRIGYQINLSPQNVLKERAIICVSYKWENSRVKHFQWDRGCDRQLLIDFMKICNEADEIIAHNGDRYDIKWLRTRCLFHGIDAFPDYTSIDTLKLARSGFNFNSNKLDYIASFLGLGHKGDPGGYQTWIDICEHNDEKAMKRMLKYCDKDVTLLQQVYEKLIPYIKQKTHRGVFLGGIRQDCPECASRNTKKNGRRVTRAGTVSQRMQCSDCAANWQLKSRKSEK